PAIDAPVAAMADRFAPRRRLPLLAPLGPMPVEAQEASVLLEPGDPAGATDPTPRAPRKPRAPLPSLPSSPPAAADASLAVDPRAPGAPPRLLFDKRAESIAPGVYACMQQHSPELRTLRLALTVGGPRHTPAAMALPEHDTPELRRCIARLLLRLDFPATEGTARYEHVYRR
ncbi:MAG TPA: hypothetical protein VGB85_23035, partial [Nannocystis sp.]